VTVSSVYVDARDRRDPWVVTVKRGSIVENHRFRDQESAELAHKRLVELAAGG
jgi:hypothetical protein